MKGSMYKLATHIPNMIDASSWYRSMGPLADMRRQMPELTTHHLAKYSWATLAECDAVFLQRPYTHEEVSIIEIAKDVGVPVWVDYDDLLLKLPTDNPGYFLYETHKKNIVSCIQYADHVTVSTPELKRFLDKFNKNVTVIPNAIDMRYFKYRTQPPKRTSRMVWRGSKTHHRDVFTYCQTIFSKHSQYEKWEFQFIGDNLWFLTDNMAHQRTIVMPGKEWPDYFRHIWKIAPAAMLAPLHEHEFNWCKSNIAWLEGSFAGAVTIAPDWEEWQRPGVLTFKNENEFGSQMDKVLSGSINVDKMAKDAWDFIQENLTLQKVNKLRLDMLISLNG